MESIPFVDRVAELEKLLSYAEKGFYPVLFIYGPEGCGKTRLLKEFINKIRDRRDYIVVYVDAQSIERVEEAVLGPRELVNYIATAIESVSGSIGRIVAQLLPVAMRKALEHRLKGKKLVVAIDDVARPLGIDLIESYAKKLLDLVEWAIAIGVDKVFVLATTSEGVSYRYLARHNYVALDTVWNLDRRSALELLEILRAPQDLHNHIYRLTGGNPRMMIELSSLNWSVDTWSERIVKRYRHLVEILKERFRDEVLEVLNDIDRLTDYPELRDLFLEYNLVIPIARPCLGYTPPIDRELGIGRLYAWQVPIYREVIARLLESDPADSF